jgi:hypothetical protein
MKYAVKAIVFATSGDLAAGGGSNADVAQVERELGEMFAGRKEALGGGGAAAGPAHLRLKFVFLPVVGYTTAVADERFSLPEKKKLPP